MNNAGISPKGPGGSRLGAIQTPLEDWKWVFQVNFFASIMLARGLVEELRTAHGAVVNVTSIAGSRVHPFAGAAYATSKAALKMLTQNLAEELAKDGVRVNAIAPGPFATAMTLPTREDPARREKFLSRIPMGRFGEPEDLDGALLLLASDAGRAISGATLAVDGAHMVSSL